jgi:hypothetical protein
MMYRHLTLTIIASLIIALIQANEQKWTGQVKEMSFRFCSHD